MHRLFKILGNTWAVLVGLIILLSMALQFAKYGLWAGIAAIGNLLNPFNIGNFLVSIVLFSPSLLFFWLATKFPEPPAKPVALNQSTHGPSAPSRVKGILQVIALLAVGAIGILFVGLTWYRDLIRPYTWSRSVVQEAKARGWDLAIERKGRDLFPWTWVVPFPRVLGFVETAAVRHAGELIFAPMLWIIREQEHDVIEPLVQLHVLNIKSYMVAKSKADVDQILRGGTGPKVWLDMDKELLGYFCNPPK